MKNLKRLFSYMNGQWPLYGSAIIFTLLSQIIVALQPQLIKITIDSVIGNDPLTNTLIAKVISFSKLPLKGAAGLLSMAGFVFVFALLRGLCSFLRINLASAATERSVKNLRNRLYNHIQLLPYAYHANGNNRKLNSAVYFRYRNNPTCAVFSNDGYGKLRVFNYIHRLFNEAVK